MTGTPTPMTRRRLLAGVGQLGSLAAVALLTACGGATATTASSATTAAAQTSTAAAQTSTAATTAQATLSTAATTQSAAATSSATSLVTTSAATTAPAATTTTAVSTAASTAAPAATSQVQKAGQTLRFMWVDTGQQVWRDAWKQMLDGFTAANAGLTVDADPVDFGKASEKALTILAGGGYYDYLYGYFGWLSGWVTKQVIQPLDPFLAKDKEVSASDFYPAATEHYKGKLYGLAWFTNGKEIWYNADLFKAAGQQTPKDQEKAGTWTWQALLDSAQKLTKTSGDKTAVYGYSEAFNYLPTFVMHMWAWGAAPYTDDFSKATFDTKQQSDSLQFAADMVTKYKVAGGGDFTKSGVAMLETGSFYVRTADEQILPKNPFTIEMAPLPKGPTGERPVALANNCNYVGASAKLPELAWALNKYLLSAPAQPPIARLGGGRYVASKKVKPVTTAAYEDATVYAQSLARSQGTPLIGKESDVEKDWTDGWKNLTDGKVDVKGMLATMQQQATIYLQQAGCVC